MERLTKFALILLLVPFLSLLVALLPFIVLANPGFIVYKKGGEE